MYELDHSLKKEMDERWKESQPLWQQWWYEADLDVKMTTGQQDYWNTFYNVNYRNQKILQFNKILRVLNMIDGYQRDNRLATLVTPVENEDMQTAEQFTKLMTWTKNQDNTYQKISDCNYGAMMTGLNLLNIWMDFREDPENGEIKTSRIPFNAVIMDNYWTDPKLSDCDWIWTRRYLTRQQVLSLYPKIATELTNFGKGYGSKDGRFQFLAQNWYQYQQELYAYDEYWKRDYRTVYKALDRATGEIIDWPGTKDQFQLLKRYNPNVDLIKVKKPTVKLHVLINNHLVYEEQRPYGSDSYPFVPFLCYHNTEVQNYAYRYQGITRQVRDSQIELNRRRNRMLDIFDAQIQSGIMVKEDALVNPEDAFLQGPGRVLYFKQTAQIGTDSMIIPPPNIPPSLFELNKMLEEDIMNQAGITPELMGEDPNGNDMSGFLHQLRMGAGLKTLQGLFDKLNHSQKQVGDIMLEMLQNNFEPGKVKNIIGEEPTNEFYQKAFLKYHCVCEEGQLTTTQKQLQFIQALNLKNMGIPIPTDYLLEKSNLQGKKDLIDSIRKSEAQQAQMAQAQQEAELVQTQMLGRSLEAKSQSDFASAQEKKTRAVSNIGLAKERTSQSVHDRATAALDNVKALKELSHMDSDLLMRQADFLLNMQERQKALAGNEEGDSIQEEEALTSSVQQKERQV